MKKLNAWLVLLAGLFIIAFGVASIIRADVGVLPTTCLPYVLSNVFGITVGEAIIIFYVILLTGQLVVLRKKCNIVQLLQIPIGLSFGYITDFALFVLQDISFSGSLTRWILFLAGVLISAIGVSLEVIAGVGTLPTEGFVIAVSKVYPIRFGTMKIIFDLCLVLISLIVSLISLHHVIGIREGTLLSAILLGLFSRYIMNIYQKCCDKKDRHIEER